MASPPDDDDDGDYLIQLTPDGEGEVSQAAARKGSSRTVKAETRGHANVEKSGVATAKPNLVIQLAGGKTVELQPGWSLEREESSVVVEDTPSVIVAAGRASSPILRRAETALVHPTAPQRSGVLLLVIVYLLATTALGLAIYERFG